MPESKSDSNGLKKYLVTVGTALTTAIIIQSSVLFYWGGEMSARMNGAERNIDHVQTRLRHLEQRK